MTVTASQPRARRIQAPTVPPRTATILSVGTELPADVLTSADLAEQLGITEEWILTRTGIRERRRARPEERLSDYAARAGAAALKRAGVNAADLDMVIVATLTADELTPNVAPIVADELGARRAGTFDVGAACTAFLTGLQIGAAQIESGRADTMLLIGADFVTRITDFTDRRTAALFADAAGAVVLGRARTTPRRARSARSCSAPTGPIAARSTSSIPTARSGWTAPRCSSTR